MSNKGGPNIVVFLSTKSPALTVFQQLTGAAYLQIYSPAVKCDWIWLMASKVTRQTETQTCTHIPPHSIISWAKFPSERKLMESNMTNSPLITPQVWNTALHPHGRPDIAKSPATVGPAALIYLCVTLCQKQHVFLCHCLRKSLEVSLTFPFCPIQQSQRGKTKLEEHATCVVFCCTYGTAWISEAMFWKLSLLSAPSKVNLRVTCTKHRFFCQMSEGRRVEFCSECKGLGVGVFWAEESPKVIKPSHPSSVHLILLIAPRLCISAFIRDRR